MKYCTKCARSVKPKENFCPSCGGTKFTDNPMIKVGVECQGCGKKADHLWTCTSCTGKFCRNCVKTTGYLDTLCIKCAEEAEKGPEAPKPAEEPKIEPIAVEEQGFFSKAIGRIKGIFGGSKTPAAESTNKTGQD